MIDLQKYPVQRGFEEIEEIYEIAERYCGYIAGSYAAYMAAPELSHIIQPNDIDIFATSEISASHIYTHLEKIGYYMQRQSEIAYSMSAFPDPSRQLDVQIIFPNPSWRKFPDDIVNSFDLTVSRAILIDEKTVLGDPEIGSKRARILRIENPMKSLSRVVKYVQRGVEFPEWELLKLFAAWDEISEERRLGIAERVANDRPENMVTDHDDIDYAFISDDDYFEGE